MRAWPVLRYRCPAVLAAAVLVAVAWVVSVPSAHAASDAHIAKTLANGIANAKSPAARLAALRSLVRVAGVPVYKPDGSKAAGAEPRSARLYLYDFELRILAQRSVQRRTVSFSSLTRELEAAGLKPHGGDLPPSVLGLALSKALRQAGAKSSSHRVGALLLRDLGALSPGHPDLARHPATSKTRLDPIQAELIVLAFAAQADSWGSTTNAASVRASDVTSTCDKLEKLKQEVSEVKHGLFEGGFGGIGGKAVEVLTGHAIGQKLKALGESYPRFGNVMKALNKLNMAIDALHAILLGSLVEVKGDPELVKPPVHYNHSASEHHVMEMRVRVEMTADAGKILVHCGDLAGLKLPPKGGIKDVPVKWDKSGLARHGTIVCGADCDKTNKDGVATLRLAMKTEQIPGYGLERDDTGNADAVALYQTALGGSWTSASGLVQLLQPKIGGVRWHVTWHEEPKLSLRLTSDWQASYTNQKEACDALGCWTTGSGSQRYALSASAPLAKLTPSGSDKPLWTGDAPLNWDAYSYNDDGVSMNCQDGYFGTIDYDGMGDAPGELIVDSVELAPNGSDPGVTLTFHDSVQPTVTTRDTWHHGGSACADYTNSHTDDYQPDNVMVSGGTTGVQWVSSGGTHESPTYRVTGWTRGPSTGGAAGVYAYRDFSFSRTDAYGQPYSGHFRLALVATPQP